jgi:hypothetical protein
MTRQRCSTGSSRRSERRQFTVVHTVAAAPDGTFIVVGHDNLRAQRLVPLP